jgi:hypothetical protein
LIGAYGVDDQRASSGCAYVFRFNGREWIEEQKLHASDGAPYDRAATGAAFRQASD